MIRHRHRRAALRLGALVLCLCPNVTRASSLFELAGAATSSNGLNARAMARGGAAAFYNPALLPGASRETEIGFSVLVTRGDIDLARRPASVDVAPAIYDARLSGAGTGDTFLPLPTSELPSRRADTELRTASTYVTLGVVEPIASERFVFGFYGVLPLDTFHRQDPFFPDEREQYFGNSLNFELLGDRAELVAFAVALGSRPLDWLSVGVGADVTIGNRAVTSGYVPDGSDQRTVVLSPDVKTESVLSPFFGVVTAPSKSLDLTATAHLPVSSRTDGENRIRFFNYDYPDDRGYVLQKFEARQGYLPLRFSVGGVWTGRDEAGRERFQLGGHALLSRWSRYVDRNGERPRDAWRNTISVGLGAATRFGPHRFSADLFYAPTPVPDQRGRTNYVDNSKLMASLGLDTRATVLGVPLGIGLYLHGQVFLPRETTKSPLAASPIVDEFPDGSVDALTGARIPESDGLQTNNPGFPGFSSTGYIAGAGLSLKLPDVTEIGGTKGRPSP